MKQKKTLKKISEELGLGLLGVLGTSIETKVGLAIFLLIVALGILCSPKSEDINYTHQILVGFGILLTSIFLIILRIKELNKTKTKK